MPKNIDPNSEHHKGEKKLTIFRPNMPRRLWQSETQERAEDIKEKEDMEQTRKEKQELLDPKQSLGPEMFGSPATAEIFMCAICLLVPNPKAAVEHVSCGKLFCGDCLTRWKKVQNRMNCPACNQPSDTRATRSVHQENKMLHSLMEGLVVKCPTSLMTSGESCGWADSWSNLETHLKECPYNVVRCKYACGLTLIRKLMLRHEAEECRNRTAPCGFCGSQIKLPELETHGLRCDRNPERVLDCPFIPAGCTFKGKKLEIETHLAGSKEQHLELSATYISRSEKTLQNQSQQLAQLEHRLKVVNFCYFTTCVKGHKLQRIMEHARYGSYTCNVCGKSGLSFRNGDWRCDPCDWDCCPQCHDIKYIEEGKEPYKYSRCGLKPEEHALVLTQYSRGLPTFQCAICHSNREGDSDTRFWCVYCRYHVCASCQGEPHTSN